MHTPMSGRQLASLGLGLGLLALATATSTGEGPGAILQLQLAATACAAAAALAAGVGAVALLRGAGGGIESGLQVASQLAVGHCALLLVLAALFSRPTWGLWWIWDPLLSTAAVGMISFSAVHNLRQSVMDPQRRTRWSAVAALLAVLNLPLTFGALAWRATTEDWASHTLTGALQLSGASVLHGAAFALCTLGLADRMWALAEARARADAPEPL